MSELILGLIPPELFMIWAITSRPITSYFIYVLIFSILSYTAGFAAFNFGKYLHNTWLYDFMKKILLENTKEK